MHYLVALALWLLLLAWLIRSASPLARRGGPSEGRLPARAWCVMAGVGAVAAVLAGVDLGLLAWTRTEPSRVAERWDVPPRAGEAPGMAMWPQGGAVRPVPQIQAANHGAALIRANGSAVRGQVRIARTDGPARPKAIRPAI